MDITMKRMFHHVAVFCAAAVLAFLFMEHAGDRLMLVLIPYASPLLFLAFRLAGTLCLYMLYLLLWSRRKGPAVKIPEAFIFVFSILYLFILLTMLFGRSYDVYEANYIPFHTIREYIDRGWDHLYVWSNLLGNILPFIPLGGLLMRLFQRKRWTLAGILVCILTIEFSQQALSRGSFDVDDILLNVLGAICGAWLYDRLRLRAEQQKG
nr:VanZ family protein [Ectobacillus ponti]